MVVIHLPEIVRAVRGTRAACLCGWVSEDVWPETEVGLQGCRSVAWRHAAEARRRTESGTDREAHTG